MNSVEKKLDCLKGLIKDTKLDDNQKKLFNEVFNLFSDLSNEFNALKCSYDNLKEYAEQLDSDLTNIEDEVYGLNTEDIICDEDEYTDDDFKEIKCPKCSEAIFVDKSLFNQNESLECPNCRYKILLNDSLNEI